MTPARKWIHALSRRLVFCDVLVFLGNLLLLGSLVCSELADPTGALAKRWMYPVMGYYVLSTVFFLKR